MPKESSSPRQFPGVMVSSTFTDLKDHRAALIEIIDRNDFHSMPMEHDSAKPTDVIRSSLEKVRKCAVYVCVIGKRYGQVPVCHVNNPSKLSLTELEFNEALRLDLPILLFLMGTGHPVLEADIETSSAKRKKLAAFRERAKQMGNGSQVQRVWAEFNSLRPPDLTPARLV